MMSRDKIFESDMILLADVYGYLEERGYQFTLIVLKI